jgi:hypothetical protein
MTSIFTFSQQIAMNFSGYHHLIATIYCAATYSMTGLIWLVQLVHYPTYRFIEEKEFAKFQKFHVRTITFIVGPVMMLELFSISLLLGIGLLTSEETLMIKITEIWIQFILTFVIWISTVIFSIPLHHLLEQKKDLTIIRRLVLTNWPRTIFWSIKSVLWSIAIST